MRPPAYFFIFSDQFFSRTTATSFTFVPVGPVRISPSTFSRAW